MSSSKVPKKKTTTTNKQVTDCRGVAFTSGWLKHDRLRNQGSCHLQRDSVRLTSPPPLSLAYLAKSYLPEKDTQWEIVIFFVNSTSEQILSVTHWSRRERELNRTDYTVRIIIEISGCQSAEHFQPIRTSQLMLRAPPPPLQQTTVAHGGCTNTVKSLHWKLTLE